jgi:hypothetical protein
MPGQTIEGYIASLKDWRAEVVRQACELVLRAAPDATATIKWSQPVFELNGPFAYVRAFKESVNIGFWRGTDLEDPEELLRGTGDRMKHVTVAQGGRLRATPLRAFIKQAAALNLEMGDPTGRRA